MKEHPILMSASMIRATLEDRKSNTRRAMTPQPSASPVMDGTWKNYWLNRCPYGGVGDRLWVKETWAVASEYDTYSPSKIPKQGRTSIWYLADGQKLKGAGRTRPSIHMPRWASRLTLEIVSIRVERVQDISKEDAFAEGVERALENPIVQFILLWASLNKKRGFDSNPNPWVWVIEFRRVETKA